MEFIPHPEVFESAYCSTFQDKPIKQSKTFEGRLKSLYQSFTNSTKKKNIKHSFEKIQKKKFLEGQKLSALGITTFILISENTSSIL